MPYGVIATRVPSSIRDYQSEKGGDVTKGGDDGNGIGRKVMVLNTKGYSGTWILAMMGLS
jgi:hypothetical protein